MECQKQQRDLLSKSGYSLSFCAIILQTDDIWLVPKGQLLRKHTIASGLCQVNNTIKSGTERIFTLAPLSSKRFSITCHCLSVRSICKIPFYYSLSTISSLYSKTKGDKKRPTDRLLNQIKAISFIYFDFTRYHDSTDTID